MGKHTGIAWCDHTWNPWRGCTKVSPGCRHCYMFREQSRYGQDPSVVVRTSGPTFGAPLRWKAPGFVFTCSWSDFFHEAADRWRSDAWDIIARTPHLTYLILTKRPERIERALPLDWSMERYPNVWLGVSVEQQEQARARIPILCDVECARRFLSCEPLLGPLDLASISRNGDAGECYSVLRVLDWVIVGGESGPIRRDMDLAWAEDVQRQCDAYDVYFWFKQRSNARSGVLTGVPAALNVQERPYPLVGPQHA